MKNLIKIILLGSMLTMSSCGTYTGEGALIGAEVGSVVGSLFGGISGGWRGSDVGQLVGMAGGAAVGAAVGAAADQKFNERLQQTDEVYQQRKTQQHKRTNVRYEQPSYTDVQYIECKEINAQCDDRIDFDAPGPRNYKVSTRDTIREIHFGTKQ